MSQRSIEVKVGFLILVALGLLAGFVVVMGGLSLQHYLILGKLLFGQQFAWYVTSNTGYQKNIYQRYILEYEVKRN